jgi:hypothetical protein
MTKLIENLKFFSGTREKKKHSKPFTQNQKKNSHPLPKEENPRPMGACNFYFQNCWSFILGLS